MGYDGCIDKTQKQINYDVGMWVVTDQIEKLRLIVFFKGDNAATQE